MSTSSDSDPLELYDALVMEGRAPRPEEFSARYPDHPDLFARIQALDALRGELDAVAGSMTELRDSSWPSRIGVFDLADRLGTGGMGVVFSARDRRTGAPAAVKLLRSKSALALERFRREASLLSEIRHPAIPSVLSFGVEHGQAYFATELVSGCTLAELIDESYGMKPVRSDEPLMAPVRQLLPMTIRGVVRIAMQVAEAVGHAHERGIVHRDIKPSNVMITAAGETKLIDFGLAVALTASTRLTKTGAFLGSPQYAAPEQLRGEKATVGPRSDVYSLGATLFELLAHRTPFSTSSAARAAAFEGTRVPHGPRHFNTDVPWRLERLVLKTLSPKPSRRPASGAELARALERWC